MVRVYECNPYALRPFFIMERCEGSLADKISSVPLGMQVILDCLIHVCLGLSHCHYRKIIHRDLKPANILGRKDRWVLADFGMSLLANEGTVVSVPESLPGTIPYTSPEVMYYDPSEIGPPADIFSLGVTLKEMLTGTNSWQGKPSSLLQHRVGDVRRREVECFDSLITQMMSLRPEDRPQTVAEVAKMMKEVFHKVNQIYQFLPSNTSQGPLQRIERLDDAISSKLTP